MTFNLGDVTSSAISRTVQTGSGGRTEFVDVSSKVRTKHVEKVDLHNQKAVQSDVREVETIVKKLNGFIDPTRTNLKFVFHEELNEYYVTVVDQITHETIKEIPSKKLLDMYASMADFMGLLMDQKI